MADQTTTLTPEERSAHRSLLREIKLTKDMTELHARLPLWARECIRGVTREAKKLTRLSGDRIDGPTRA